MSTNNGKSVDGFKFGQAVVFKRDLEDVELRGKEGFILPLATVPPNKVDENTAQQVQLGIMFGQIDCIVVDEEGYRFTHSDQVEPRPARKADHPAHDDTYDFGRTFQLHSGVFGPEGMAANINLRGIVLGATEQDGKQAVHVIMEQSGSGLLTPEQFAQATALTDN